MEVVDVVVVGAGVAGLTAAYYAAKEGLEVLVLERGDAPGSKNLTGGRLYVGPLRGIAEEILEGAPFERRVAIERISAMGEKGSTTVSFFHRGFGEPGWESYTVLRSRLDEFLARRVAENGGYVVPEKKVDRLLVEGQKIVGILSDGEEIRAKVVILAEGALGLLARDAGLFSPPMPREVALGIKEVIELGEESLASRFGLGGEEGVAHLFWGACTQGIPGGGFLYTNKDTISLGLVLRVKPLLDADKSPYELMEGFKAREEISVLISGGRTVEYGAHMIPEKRRIAPSSLIKDGCVVVGDAAGLSLNMGITVRGMDMAMASGRFASEAVAQAIRAKDSSAQTLSVYVKRLQGSFVYKDIRTFSPLEELLASQRLYRVYPELFNEAMYRVFRVGAGPKEKFSRSIWRTFRAEGWALLKDLWKGRGI